MYLNPVFFWHYILCFRLSVQAPTITGRFPYLYLTYINICAIAEKLSHLEFFLLFPFPSEEEELRRAAPSPCKLSLRNAWQCDWEFLWPLAHWFLWSVYVYAVYSTVTDFILRKREIFKLLNYSFTFFFYNSCGPKPARHQMSKVRSYVVPSRIYKFCLIKIICIYIWIKILLILFRNNKFRDDIFGCLA